MTQEAIQEIIRKQRNYFYTGATLNIDFRITALKKLQTSIQSHQEQINAALKSDLGKSSFESYMCESGLVLSEITYMLKHIRSLSREKTVHTPLAQFHSRSYMKPSPYGVTLLIMSPWNYPFLLTFDPLVDAIAAGNTAVLKPSAYSPATSNIICEIVRGMFSGRICGRCYGRAPGKLLSSSGALRLRLFYRQPGCRKRGHAPCQRAPHSSHPGAWGKSPCIVDKSANIKLTAKRIVFGKYLNCGQTCVAPDYIYCHREVKDELLKQIQKQIRKQFGKSPLDNKNYGKIINEKHFNRIQNLIDPAKIICGGNARPETLQIEPTVMDQVTFEDAVMQEEIFGPVMPVLTFNSIDEVIRNVNSMAHPLALYIFAQDKAICEKVTSECGFGGGCINDVIIHLATSEMPFGGFGESGMGSYHGQKGFETFSHYKSIVDKKTWIDLPMRYQPYRRIYDHS